MPQLDVSTYSGQLFWLGILFALLFIMVHFYFVPRMRRIFRIRDLNFRKKIAFTKQLKKEIDQVEKNITLKEKYAHDHIRSIIHEAELQSQQTLLDRKHALSVLQQGFLREFEKELEEVRESFLMSSKEEETLTRTLMKKIMDLPLPDAVYKEALAQKDLSSYVA